MRTLGFVLLGTVLLTALGPAPGPFLNSSAAAVSPELSWHEAAPVAGEELPPSYYVEYTSYKKNQKTGVVTRLGSGKVGPFPTRREAQSVVDDYNSNESNSGGYRYYYIARVR